MFQKQLLWTARETREPCARSALYTAALQCSAISWLPEGFSFRTKQAWKLRLILREGESYWKWSSLSSYFQRVTYDETRMHIATESKQVCTYVIHECRNRGFQGTPRFWQIRILPFSNRERGVRFCPPHWHPKFFSPYVYISKYTVTMIRAHSRLEF